jgi:carbon-monoxide dehydrogenase large subunit
VADALARAGHADKAPLLQMPLTAPKLWEMLNA